MFLTKPLILCASFHVLNNLSHLGFGCTILGALAEGHKRFKEIAKTVDSISDKIISKVLRRLEMNQLEQQTVQNTFPPIALYAVTKQSETLREILDALSQ